MVRPVHGVKSLVLHRGAALILVEKGGHLDLPGGRVESEETQNQTLVREISEETGLSVQIIRPLCFWEFEKHPGLNVNGITYFCLTHDNQVRLSPEHKSFLWLPLAGANTIRQLKSNLKRPYLGSGIQLHQRRKPWLAEDLKASGKTVPYMKTPKTCPTMCGRG